MAFFSARRALLLAAFLSSTLLAACGSSTVESQLNPAQIYAVGDGFGNVGQGGGGRYTINDNTDNIWADQLAARYGRDLLPVSAGGTSYAAGNARIVAKPDAAGNAATLSVQEQVSALLAARSFGSNDLILVSAGIADIAAIQFANGSLAEVRQAGRDLGAQVRRLVDAGAKYVVVVGPYNLSRSPWALIDGARSLGDFSSKFNEELKVSIVDLGANVLYVDAEFYFNLATGTPSAYGFDNVSAPACNSVDAGNGIGIGPNQVNSSLCGPGNVLAGIDPNRFLFADKLYPTPQGHRLFGNYAFDRLRARW